MPIVQIATLWDVLMEGFADVFPPTRTRLDDQCLGDAWPCKALPQSPPASPGEDIVPFHKLTQWMCYSLITPVERVLGVRFNGVDMLTGLPEYRNGGLMVDTGILVLNQEDRERGLSFAKKLISEKDESQPRPDEDELVPTFDTGDDVIVEWRAMTIALLDRLEQQTKIAFEPPHGEPLSIAQFLEAGSWKVSQIHATPLCPF